MPKAETVIPELCRNFVIEKQVVNWTNKDVILYALGVGCSADDQTDPLDLKYTNEFSEDFGYALPTFPVVLPDVSGLLNGIHRCEGMPEFNPMMLLHGEQSVDIMKPFAAEGTAFAETDIEDVLDRKKGALVILRTTITEMLPDGTHGGKMAICRMSCFIRGIGGFGYTGTESKPSKNLEGAKPSDPASIKFIEYKTALNQALLYRLSGDRNPLHSTPDMAAIGGFSKPILHGLCTLGIAVRKVVLGLLDNEVEEIGHISCRFSAPVTPGDILRVSMWKNNANNIGYEVDAITSGSDQQVKVVTNGVVQLRTTNKL